MIVYRLFLILTVIAFLLNLLLIILKNMEFQLRKLKIILWILQIINLLIYCFNIQSFFNFRILDSTTIDILKITSQTFLFFSLTIFISSFFVHQKDIVDLKTPSFYKSKGGTIEIGRVMKYQKKKHKFFLSLEDLERHMFICGATGTGKSNFLQYFLVNFKKKYDIPFMLAEFKGEYTFLQNIIEDLLIVRPGENFSINIFNPEGANPEIHAERIFDILKTGNFLDDSAEFSPQMERVLVDILKEVCNNPQSQSWHGFYEKCESYFENEQKNIPMLNQSLVSIKNRIRRFSLGPLKSIFATRYKLNIRDLLNKNILIDLSSIVRLGGEKEDALFFLNMILKYLWDKNLTEGAYDFKGIKHLTIVEDAQYFAPKDLTSQTKLTSYLEDIALLQRGTGECLISIATRPQVSDEILANCGVLITFKNHMEREILCELLNLDEENQDYLSILEQGQCIVRVNSIKRPFVLWVPLIKRYWLKRGEVNRKNKAILKKMKDNQLDEGKKENVKYFCKFCGKEIESNTEKCEECFTNLESSDKDIKRLDKFLATFIEKQ